MGWNPEVRERSKQIADAPRIIPEEGAGGLVLFTDSGNRVGRNVKGNVGLLWELTQDEIRFTFTLPPSVKEPAPTRVGEPFDRLPPALHRVRLRFDVLLWEKWEPAGEGRINPVAADGIPAGG